MELSQSHWSAETFDCGRNGTASAYVSVQELKKGPVNTWEETNAGDGNPDLVDATL